MKQILLIALLTLFSTFCYCQDGGPLKFLGIPIDGQKSEFAARLKSKGFIYNSISETYKGQFNGQNVDVVIHTNHNHVDRVYVAFPYTTERSIKVDFNRLLAQFNDNEKYMDLSMNEPIPVDDDISYEIIVNNKRYQASFCYFDSDRDPIAFSDALLDEFSDFFTKEQLVTLKQIAIEGMNAPEAEQELMQAQLIGMMQEMFGENDAEPDPEKAYRLLITLLDAMNSLADGHVWFMIHEKYGQYQIGLYYDNLHNMAHGEDL